MRVLAATSNTPSRLEFRDVPAPEPRPDETLISIRASSINRGERTRLASAAEGTVFGWDIAGVVEASSLMGPRFAPGDRVVGLATNGGGWAQSIALRSSDLATLPGNIDFETATSLPVAGLTALRALRFDPALLGARVLIPGATGAVGWFAVQLASMAGAKVTAIVRDPNAVEGLKELGATDIVVGDVPVVSGPDQFDFALDTIGGDVTAALVSSVRMFGQIVIVGNLAQSTGALKASGILAAGVRIQGYRLTVDAVTNPLADDLSRLLSWVAEGRLRLPEVAAFDWNDQSAIADAVDGGFAPAKPVLTIR